MSDTKASPFFVALKRQLEERVEEARAWEDGPFTVSPFPSPQPTDHRISAHELGHAAVYWRAPSVRGITHIVCLPDDAGVRVSWYSRVPRRQLLWDMLAGVLGGIAAEEVFLGNYDPYAALDDLIRARVFAERLAEIARQEGSAFPCPWTVAPQPKPNFRPTERFKVPLTPLENLLMGVGYARAYTEVCRAHGTIRKGIHQLQERMILPEKAVTSLLGVRPLFE